MRLDSAASIWLESISDGDGVEHCVARVQSDHGALELAIALHLRTGKVRNAEFRSVV
jgi:hypothetical protein